MRPRPIALVCLMALVTAPSATAASPEAVDDERFVVSGRGAAHGMGLAMDGVEGQARAGWSHTRILDLFYRDTSTGSFGGTVRVGLAEAPGPLAFVLPGGGRVSGDGLDAPVPAGARVVVHHTDGRHVVDAPGLVAAAQGEPPVPLPTAEPEPTSRPEPEPTPGPAEPTPAPTPPGSTGPIWIDPAGEPAVTLVEATGRRYRGRMQVRHSQASGTLWAINHVDLETYVMGIAEEKGQGWPLEGLKVLAVAARSLAASTMTWYGKHHPNGFDICPTGACQVYLGYDGEEPAMRQATRATAGEIRTYGGRSILAMYHGNGGGETDEYELLYGDGVNDPHPYLTAVEYPYADPSSWTFAFSPEGVKTRLASSGVVVPGSFEGAEILETGVSPRVVRMRVRGSEGPVELPGRTFQAALELPSAWFDVGTVDDPEALPAPASSDDTRAGFDLVATEGRSRRTAAPADALPGGRSVVLLALAGICAAGVALVAGDRRFGR